MSRSAHRTLKGETLDTFDRRAGGSRVSSRRVPRARDRPERQLFAVLRAISVILHAFRSSENDARTPTRPRATPKLGESEFPRRFYQDLARIDRFDARVQAAFRLCSPLPLSPSRLLAEVFTGDPPIVTWRPNRRLNTQALRINASGESSAPVNPFEAWKPAGLTVARCSRARFRGRCHPEPTLPAPGFFLVKICMRIVTESVAIFFSTRALAGKN